jgi:hypothetical protein
MKTKVEKHKLPPIPNLEEKPQLIDIRSEEVKHLLRAWEGKFRQLSQAVLAVYTFEYQEQYWNEYSDFCLAITYTTKSRWLNQEDDDLGFDHAPKKGLFTKYIKIKNIDTIPVVYEIIKNKLIKAWGDKLPSLPE